MTLRFQTHGMTLTLEVFNLPTTFSGVPGPDPARSNPNPNGAVNAGQNGSHRRNWPLLCRGRVRLAFRGTPGHIEDHNACSSGTPADHGRTSNKHPVDRACGVPSIPFRSGDISAFAASPNIMPRRQIWSRPSGTSGATIAINKTAAKHHPSHQSGSGPYPTGDFRNRAEGPKQFDIIQTPGSRRTFRLVTVDSEFNASGQIIEGPTTQIDALIRPSETIIGDGKRTPDIAGKAIQTGSQRPFANPRA